MPIALRIALCSWRAFSRMWVWARPRPWVRTLARSTHRPRVSADVAAQPDGAIDQIDQLA